MGFKPKNVLDWLKETLGEQIAMLILSQIVTKENILKAIDALLDVLEELAEKTGTQADDKALKKIREALNVPEFEKDKN